MLRSSLIIVLTWGKAASTHCMLETFSLLVSPNEDTIKSALAGGKVLNNAAKKSVSLTDATKGSVPVSQKSMLEVRTRSSWLKLGGDE